MFNVPKSGTNYSEHFDVPITAVGPRNGRKRARSEAAAIIESNGIGSDPAAEQNRVVQTVECTQYDRYRGNYAEEVIGGCFNPDVPKPAESYGLLKGEIFFTLGENKYLGARDSKHGEPFAAGTTSMLNLKAKYYKKMKVLGVISNPSQTRGDKNSVADNYGACFIGGTHEITNTGPDFIPNGSEIFACPNAWTKELDAERKTYLPHVHIKGTPPNKMLPRIIALDTKDKHENMRLIQQDIKDCIREQVTEKGKIKMASHVTDVITKCLSKFGQTRGTRQVYELMHWGKVELARQLLLVALGEYLLSPADADIKAAVNEAMRKALTYVMEWQEWYVQFSDENDGQEWIDTNKVLPLSSSLYASIPTLDAFTNYNDKGPWLINALQIINISHLDIFYAWSCFVDQFYAGGGMSAAESGKSLTLRIKNS